MRKLYKNRGSKTIGVDQIFYFRAPELSDIFDLDAGARAGYQVGVPLPGGHNRYTLVVTNLDPMVTYDVWIDAAGTGTITEAGGGTTDTGWTPYTTGVVGNQAIIIGDGAVPGQTGGSTKFPTTSIYGFRLSFSSDASGAVINIIGQSVGPGIDG